jgi:hypothetical protein
MTINIILAVGTFVAVAGLILLAIWALGEEGRQEEKWVKEYMKRNRADGEQRWQETGGDEWKARLQAALDARDAVARAREAAKGPKPLEFNPDCLISQGSLDGGEGPVSTIKGG